MTGHGATLNVAVAGSLVLYRLAGLSLGYCNGVNTAAITPSSLGVDRFRRPHSVRIAVFIFGLVLLIRGVAHQGPTTKAEGPAGFKFEGGPGATILLAASPSPSSAGSS